MVNVVLCKYCFSRVDVEYIMDVVFIDRVVNVSIGF